MADSRKTEKPTPKKLQEAFGKGQFARSTDMTAAIELGAAGLSIYFLGTYLMGIIYSSFYENFRAAANLTAVDFDFFKHLLLRETGRVMSAVIPFGITFVTVGLMMGAFQTGGLKFADKVLNPDFNRLNPIAGMSKFFTARSWVELLKGLFKLGVVGYLVYNIVQTEKDKLLTMAGSDVWAITNYAQTLMLEVMKKIFIFTLILGLLDYAWQKKDFINNLKMSKQEVKEEAKNAEGDMQTKAKIKSWFRRRIKMKIIANVKNATFVAVNPTHYAVAIKYKKGMPAPQLLSKGVDELAMRIKAEAKKHNVPVIENPPLAREIFATTEIGKYIPAKLFKAVAKILAFLYRTKKAVK